MIARRRGLRSVFPISALAIIALLVGCGGDDDSAAARDASPATTAGPAASASTLRVVEVDLGRSIDASSRITNDIDDFSPSDTIYASVATDGTHTGATLVARWTFEDGQVVDETSRSIAPTGPSNTEFHISMPAGFPTGDYNVEILLDGQSVGRESFEVR